MAQVKFTGIKKAVGEFNHWQGPAIINLDKSSGEVWTDIFSSAGSYNAYHSRSIVEIYGKATWSMQERDDRISMKDLQKIANDYMTREDDEILY